MVERKPNEVKIVGWLLVAKKLIKFANDETSYKISDNVMAKSNFDKFPLKKGDTVEVSVAEGVVTFLRKQKSDAPKAESHGSEEAYEPTPEEEAGPTPKVEAPAPKAEPVAPLPVAESGVKELTVFAVAANKKVVKFLECKEAGWFQIAEAIQAQDYKVIGLEAKKKANVLITENTVMSFQKVASEPAEQPKTATSSPVNAKTEPTAAPVEKAPVQAAKKEWKPYNASEATERQISIESQCSLNASAAIVGRIAATISPAPTANVINSMVKNIAESNMELIQELKKKYAK